MKSVAKITVQFQTALLMQEKEYLVEYDQARAFVEACAIAGVKVVSQTVGHVLSAKEVADDIANERQISARLAGNALTTALEPQKLLG
jgi:hypothetical protein